MGRRQATARRYWVFHANPTRSDALQQLRDGQRQVRRCVTQHAADIAVGDGAVLWLSGASAGVYALGEVAGDVEANPASDGARGAGRSCLLRWSDVRPDAPVTRAVLLAAGGFDRARIIRQPMGGNPLRLTEGEWRVVQALS